MGRRGFTQRTWQREATDGKGMTVEEIRQFVGEIEVPATVKVRLSWGGGIKSMTITETDESAAGSGFFPNQAGGTPPLGFPEETGR